jgi:hypothetical protein
MATTLPSTNNTKNDDNHYHQPQTAKDMATTLPSTNNTKNDDNHYHQPQTAKTTTAHS